MYRVRFHLQSGKHYKHWQICQMNGSRRVKETYYDPSAIQLELVECKLVNKAKIARKVHAEGVRDVAGWVECLEVKISENPVDGLERLFYNPILDPNWRRDGDNGEFEWDNYKFDILISYGKQLYVLEERSSG
jgi:hypothetical protein